MHPKNPNDKDHQLLLNPLSAEFGVRTKEDMDSLIKDTLPDFKLVSWRSASVKQSRCSTVHYAVASFLVQPGAVVAFELSQVRIPSPQLEHERAPYRSFFGVCNQTAKLALE